MTDDKDLKRLVRQRMVKTGESYTAARAHFRPPNRPAPSHGTLDDLRQLYTRAGLDRLAAHLEGHHGISVRRLTELDLGVFRVDRQDGAAWVARVFPAARSVDHVEGDAAVLRFLADKGFTAERCAGDQPVTVHEGQGVLVTEHLTGLNARMDVRGETLFALGEMLGRLHALSGDDKPTERVAGGWHQISINGGDRRADVNVLLPLLSAREASVPPQEREAFHFVVDQLGAVDGCDDLPATLIHTDACGANTILSTGGTPVLVDWTGAGHGARVISLGALIAGTLHPVPGAPSSRDLRRIDAIVAGYRTHVRLTAAELAKLAAAIAGGGIVLDCWSLLMQNVPLGETARSITDRLAISQRAAERVMAAFDLDDEELTGWFRPSAPAVHPGQARLF